MEHDTVKSLVKQRGIYIAALTRMHTFINNYDAQKDGIKVEGRLRDLPTIRENFERIQLELELNDESQNHSIARENFEDTYYTVLGHLEALAKSLQSSQNVSSSAPTISNGVAGALSNVHLPKISIPQFSGDYKEWISFKDTFESLVVDNSSLTGVQMLHYLFSALKGEAKQLVSNIPISNDNFVVAWELINVRYDNPRLIAVRHVHELLSPPSVSEDSSIELRRLINHMISNKNALEALKLDTSLFELVLTQIMLNKLDNRTKKEFEIISASKKGCDWSDLNQFLENRCQALEVVNVDTRSTNKSKSKPIKFKTDEVHKFAQSYVSTDEQHCTYCNQSHVIYRCEMFKGLTISQRLEFVKSKNLCFNCLLTNKHKSPHCKSSSCRVCKRKHHTLLHAVNGNVRDTGASYDSRSQPTPGNEVNARSTEVKAGSYCSFEGQENVRVLLATALVHVVDSTGVVHKARCLLDSCSQSSYVTERLVQRLNLRKSRTYVPIEGISGISQQSKYCVKLSFKSRISEFAADVHCLVLSKITNSLPARHIDTSKWNLPTNIQLADPEFYTPGNIDILLGAEVFFDVMKNDRMSRPGDWPVLQDTHLGYILSGRFHSTSHVPESSQNFFLCNDALDQQLTKFWELEDIPNDSKGADHEIFESHFKKTVVRDNDGRFVVSFPFKKDSSNLGESYQNALSRFYLLERRFARQPVLAEAYKTFMAEYEELNHMEEVKENETVDLKDIYYIPHHAVFKESSSTTKLRVVFDCSSKTSSGCSLNDLLLAGPTLQQDLYSIVLRFRTHPVVFTADIEKMYRNILICPEQRRFQHILWRSNSKEPIRIYELRTLTYGMVPSSFLATRCLQQLASEEETRNSALSRVLKEDFYMDDVLTGAENFNKALQLQQQLIQILLNAGFPLRKFSSNHPTLIEAVPTDCRETQLPISLDKESGVKTLGILWHPISDKFLIAAKDFNSIIRDSSPTKRQVMSIVSSVFDPIGLIGPYIIGLKMFMQVLWSHNLQWDEPLPRSLRDTWCELSSQLLDVKCIQIDRYVLSSPQPKEIQVHAFCDASEKAYGCCIYLRSVSIEGNICVTLLCAKSRVAPLKKTTLPRLELCASALMAKLVHKTIPILKLNISQIFYWSDSMVVLGWLSSPASRWKTFVGNRVAQIQRMTEVSCWRHVSSADNPADLISRGLKMTDLQQSTLWWQGATWLKQPQSCWPKQGQAISKEVYPEERNSASKVLISLIESDKFIERFSSLSKLTRVVAYCRRFIYNARYPDRIVGTLSSEELKTSLKIIIKIAQCSAFKKEIDAIRKNEPIPRSSRLLNLHPFLDNEEVLRVGGRLNQSLLPNETKHQMILPPEHHLTTLIVGAEHHRLLHGGSELMVSSLRQQYWIPRIRQVVRPILHKCLQCVKLKGATRTQLMGQLPDVRVQASRPFTNVGVDFAGPLMMKVGSVRSKTAQKCYVALFVCMCTKAIHIELVSSLSSSAFLAALKRFTARRGKCSRMYSDNGTNFVKANNELQEFQRLLSSPSFRTDLEDFAAREQFRWHFIPPGSPHFGGLWEANIKCLKHHLRRTVGSHILTYEELCTLLCQIEACLNSRPLTVLSNNPDDPLPLTPGHFLIGSPLVSFPEPDLSDVPLSQLRRWERLQHFLQYLWKRWSTSYLSGLQQRLKWKTVQPNVPVGTVVLIRDENIPPLQWKMAVVERTYPGNDGLVRTVDVRTAKGIFKRPLNKLVPLPTHE